MIRLVVGLLCIAVPVLELAVLIKIGQWIGVWPTVGLVVTTAFTGILIISQQSFTVLRRTLEAVSEGHPPVAPVLDGLFLMVAGALLLTPGLMTDVLALLLLVPPIRHAVARWSMRHLLRHAEASIGGDPARDKPGERHQRETATEGPIIEGEFERLGETAPNHGPRRGNGTHTPSKGQTGA
ncbi:MAG: FxsA family protein [Hyphomonadaceae bacterium]|jgi:UPF0716 protein FxsA|nr:FxsA family protein [Hyphomonadaceae bacterium]